MPSFMGIFPVFAKMFFKVVCCIFVVCGKGLKDTNWRGAKHQVGAVGSEIPSRPVDQLISYL